MIEERRMIEERGMRFDELIDYIAEKENTPEEISQITFHYDDGKEISFKRIIHCKDCKWYNPAGLCERLDCESMTDEDYCSMGERREE